MSHTHTPGPWKVGSKHPTRVIAGKKTLFCVHPDFEDDTESGDWMEDFANARLVASCPELLAACETAYKAFRKISSVDEETKALQILREAISKANGE